MYVSLETGCVGYAFPYYSQFARLGIQCRKLVKYYMRHMVAASKLTEKYMYIYSKRL